MREAVYFAVPEEIGVSNSPDRIFIRLNMRGMILSSTGIDPEALGIRTELRQSMGKKI